MREMLRASVSALGLNAFTPPAYVTQWSDDGGLTWHTADAAVRAISGAWTFQGLPAGRLVQVRAVRA